ncbi:hypothetical protein Nepgr_012579 [Nepenthes gracilis]|uniref:Uncharacterized protein n=1 Tax=Nepenthes gracilis TaxID=150966 RepID=A0AAD3XN79_NEPGR|nr:hypothetical protein Nepgr_012579 [Nepenthes gracilis]
MESAMDASQSFPSGQSTPPPEQPSLVLEGGDGGGEGGGEEGDEELMSKAQKLMDMITSSQDNPNPRVLHALASILETEESRYMKDTGQSLNNARSSHNIGRLANLVRENDEFFELIASKFLSESRYSISVQAAATRLLLGCSPTWMYPHVFEENVLDNVKDWVMEESAKNSADNNIWKRELGENKSSDFEMRRTYSTGLLAVCLSGGGQVVEDVLTSGLSARLMHYLRTRVLREGSAAQKDGLHITESKSLSIGCGRSRDESRSRIRQVFETTPLDDPRMLDDAGLVNQGIERDHDRVTGRQVHGEEGWLNGELPDVFSEVVDNCDVYADGEDQWHGQDGYDGRLKISDRNGTGRSLCDEDYDECNRDDPSRRRVSRGWIRSRGKVKANEGAVEREHPGSGSRLGQGRSSRERSLMKNIDGKRVADTRKCFTRTASDVFAIEREDNDYLFEDCKVGTRDITDLVKSAVRAAEAEARAANAPAEAVTAAGDAAAELVKSAALDEFKTKNDEEAAILAASRAASTVIDAANAIEVTRISNADSDLPKASGTEPETNGDAVDFFIPDNCVVAQQREKFCIQCLEMLGEYIEVLGPVLHEKGVDVCLALLQQYSKNKEESDSVILLSDVLKLISALSAHRKFATLFVDRGGIQKLLSVPRVTQTFLGLASCLFTIGSLQGVMERVCALPSEIVHQIIELGLQLLECPQDQARRSAALFFAAAFVFRAVLDAFDFQDGLQKLLNLLQDAASVRSGVNSGMLGPSASGSIRNERSNAEVLTSSEKQIAFHTCVSLRQYFRAQLLLLVDSIHPIKNSRSSARSIPCVRAAYKPLDISTEAMDAIFLQIQKDRKLGPTIVRARWSAVDKFLSCNGHITMLELCQAPAVDRYLHDLLQYALGVLHIVTLVPHSRKLILNATLSNDRVGIAVILDAANGPGYSNPEIIQQALNVLINLVCPPPSISNKTPHPLQCQQSVSVQASNGPGMETRDRNAERNVSDRAASVFSQNELKDRNGESSAVDRGTSVNSTAQMSVPTLVGDRRISLGAGSGCAGLAAQLEQGYRQARDAVRANNGIKVLLLLLQQRIVVPPNSLDCLRALACRVLLGLARDDTIAHILTKLQVGKKLSELIRDLGSQTSGTEQSRWKTELIQVAIELIAIVTNSGRASTLAASDAATPTLRRIERAAIAAATPITYHSRELLLLIHEHLQACGLGTTAATLLEEAQLTPLPTLAAPLSVGYHPSAQEPLPTQIRWPSGRTPRGFLTDKSKSSARIEDSHIKWDSAALFKKKLLVFSSSFSSQSKCQNSSGDLHSPSASKVQGTSRKVSASTGVPETQLSATKLTMDVENQVKTPIVLPMKRKLTEMREIGSASSGKRLNTGEYGIRSPGFQSPNNARRTSLLSDAAPFTTPTFSFKDPCGRSTLLMGQADTLDESCSAIPAGTYQQGPSELLLGSTERLTLDSIVVQYLKHQHRQCPAPITTLPPLSLLHPHVCPEPRKILDAPSNVSARLSTREFRSMYGGIHGNRRDRQFIFSRFRPWRTCRDDAAALLTCMTFLGDSSQIASGSHSGELKLFDSNSNNVLDSCMSHQSPVTLVQSYLYDGTQLVLSSSSHDVRLWDASSISSGPIHSFEGCRAAKFSNSGSIFAALPPDPSRRDILLYDVGTYNLDQTLSDTSAGSSGRGHTYSLVHFSPSDTMLLWNGVLWDRRVSGPVHRFDQFSDYGGGGFHPTGNEVIINSEVWDLRKFRLLRSVPSLDQTMITFNGRGDVIYAILRRNIDDMMSAVNTRRAKHPLFSAFRTLDAVNYADIATVAVDRCVLDFASEPTDSFIGLVTLDDQQEMFSSARIYEIGRRRPTDDDSDPDDAQSEEDEEDDEDADVDPILGSDLEGDGDSDGDDSSDEDDDSASEDGDDDGADFLMDDVDVNGVAGLLEIVSDGDEDDDDSDVLESFTSGGDEFAGNGVGF